MGITSEIYLTKAFVSKEEWFKFIQILSNYNGILRKWKIIITNDKNQIQYFVKTRCPLPITINHLDSFLFKPTQERIRPKFNYQYFVFPNINFTIIDFINDSEIRNKGTLEYLEIHFLKFYDGKIKSKAIFYVNKKGIIKKYQILCARPDCILSIDFEGNKRYFYKKAPKYLELNKILPILSSNANHALLSIDPFPYSQGLFYLNQDSFRFDKHSVIFGSSGSGKSKLISLFIHNIHQSENLRQKYKVVVIDPHASLENDIGGIGKVIDFQNNLDSINLFMNNKDDIISSTELLLDLLKSLMADQYNSKLERVLRHSIRLLLTNESFNFRNLRHLILDLEYRNDCIKKLQYQLPTSVIEFFLSDFNDLKTKSYEEAISPIIGFIDEMEMIPIFHLEGNYENLKNTVHQHFLTLFSLDRTKLGDKVTKTIAGLIMQQLLTIIQHHEIEEHILFIIDEIAVVENPILSRYLAEARKYHLSLILAGQYFNQVSDELKNSIFANTTNYFIFRVSKLDANVFVDNFDIQIPLDNSKEKRIQLLTELQNRECVVRVESNGILLPAFKGTTIDYTNISRVKRDILEDNKQDYQKKSSNLKTDFSIQSNVSLKDIFTSHSTNKKGG